MTENNFLRLWAPLVGMPHAQRMWREEQEKALPVKSPEQQGEKP